jgi:hypothetical protein
MNIRTTGQGVGAITPLLWCAKCGQMKHRRGGVAVGKGPFMCVDCKKPKQKKSR